MFSTSVLEKSLCSALQGPLLARPSSASAPARGQRVLQLAGLHPTRATSPAFNSAPNSQSKKGKREVEKAANTN